MAGFKMHITTSTLLGFGYGGLGLYLDLPVPTCILATGLCSVSAMLPDVDSDSGIPLRESLAFGAAVVPMLMMERFSHLGWSHESMVLAGAAMYLFVRFGVGKFLKMYTVHRGMFHSLPAAAIAGLLAFLVCQCTDLDVRIYKAAAVVVGFLSHLVLDEIYSIDLKNFRLKKSFGTALKLYSSSFAANLSTYGKLALLVTMAVNDPGWMQRYGEPGHLHLPIAQQPDLPDMPNMEDAEEARPRIADKLKNIKWPWQ